MHEDLCAHLRAIVAKNTEYELRYGMVLRALPLANDLGYPVGVRIDPDEPEWPCVYIELPTGQVSWHMPQHPHPWDGHPDDEKFDRIARFVGDK